MLKPHKSPGVTTWGKKSKLLPNRAALNTINRSQHTLLDYSKETPTNLTDPIAGSPLLVNLMRKS